MADSIGDGSVGKGGQEVLLFEIGKKVIDLPLYAFALLPNITKSPVKNYAYTRIALIRALTSSCETNVAVPSLMLCIFIE